MKRTSTFFLLIACALSAFGQTQDLVATDGYANEMHRSNAGKITFMNRNIPLAEYSEKDFLSHFELTRNCNLDARIFMDNSITNYLHRIGPGLSAEEIVKKGNYRFTFTVDGNQVYTENLHPGAGLNKNTTTTLRVPLVSTGNEDLWGTNMWERFMAGGGDKALTEGDHLLKIELRTWLQNDSAQKPIIGDLIAQGQLQLKVVKPKATNEEKAIQKIDSGSGWPISKAKYNTAIVEQLNGKIATNGFKKITGIAVIKDGELLIEEYFNGANREALHDTRSVGKSFASTLMGIAIDEGYIKDENQTLAAFYDLKEYDNFSPVKEAVKIKDLLSMSSAFEGSDSDGDSPGNEENMYPTDNWVRFTLNLPIDNAKTNGGQWDYFTAGVVVLGDIIDKKVPGGLEKYSAQKLFDPLGIQKYTWQHTPQGVANTAGGLQMSVLDYAKFGQLYKNNGTWHGKQILPKSWIQKTFTRQIAIAGRENEFYGMLFWNKTYIVGAKKYEAFYCSGNGGNRIVVFKDVPLVMVITATAYNKSYAHPQVDCIIEEYLLKAVLE